MFVQLVIAAITTAPWPIGALWPFVGDGCRAASSLLGQAEAALLDRGLQATGGTPACTSASGTRSCGRFGPARLGSIVPRSSLQHLGVMRDRGAAVAAVEQLLLLGVALDQLRPRRRVRPVSRR